MKSESYHKLLKVGMATALVTSAVVVVPGISQAQGKNELDKKHDKENKKPTPTIVSVTTYKELKAAINNPKVDTIQINKHIKLTETLKVSSEKHINGNGYTLTAEIRGKKNDATALEFDKTVGSVSNIKITGADVALSINDSNVTLSGEMDVSGNKVAGIIVSKGSKSAKHQPKLDITNATLLNTDEANNKPTILEEDIVSTDTPNAVIGYGQLYAHFNQKTNNTHNVYELRKRLDF